MKHKIFLCTLAVYALFLASCKDKPENDTDDPDTSTGETFVVVFQPNGGEGTMSSQTFVDKIYDELKPNVFKHNNFAFIGWNSIANGTGTYYMNKQRIAITSNVDLHAQWADPNESSFTAYPAGSRTSSNNANFYGMEESAMFWSTTSNDDFGNFSRKLTWNTQKMENSYQSKNTGFSVRCIKD